MLLHGILLGATGLIAALYAVSDPASPQYGQYLSKDEVSKTMSRRSQYGDIDVKLYAGEQAHRALTGIC